MDCSNACKGHLVAAGVFGDVEAVVGLAVEVGGRDLVVFFA